MKKWEYEYESSRFENPKSEIIELLNRKGREGWELVCFDLTNAFFTFIFKREVQ